MGKKNWGARVLELLRKGRGGDKTKHSTHTGGTGPPPLGPAGGVFGPGYRKAVEQQLKAAQAASISAQQAYIKAQQAVPARSLHGVCSTAQQNTFANPPAWSKGGYGQASTVTLGQQQADLMDAERDQRDAEERNTGRYIVIECQITPTDESSTV